jgi:excisionase family DNA binding protein
MSRTITAGPLLTPDEVAEKLRVSKRTLETWRMKGKGPRIQRVGQFARYRAVDVDRWLDEHLEELTPRA